MPLDDLIIDTGQIKTDFRNHLLVSDNERIIFSAPFGTGKTTFLKKLAEDDDLAIVHLAPVNYSISANEDIFRLIKYDIINELLVTHLQPLEFPQVDRLTAYGVTLPEAAPRLIRSFLGAFSSLNKDLPDTEKLFELVDKIQQLIAQTEEQRNDPNLNRRIFNFMGESEKVLPMLENDFVTSFIQEGIKKLAQVPGSEGSEPSEEANTRTTILVIDDLDRLDPEHTFRLFNVFSAHLDSHNSSTNKFGFDKVIFVCDIDNVRNLFHSRYGTDTDFSGYIDKFYSNDIFHFDIGDLVAKKIVSILDTIQVQSDRGGWQSELFGEGRVSLLSILVSEMVSIRAITLRRLISRSGQTFNLRERRLGLNRAIHDDYNTRMIGVLLLEALTWLAGSAHALESTLVKARRWARSEQYRNKNYNERHLAEVFLVIAASSVHQFDINTADAVRLNNEATGYTYELKDRRQLNFTFSTRDMGLPRFTTSILNMNGEPVGNQAYPVFDLIYDAFLVLKHTGYLR